MSLKLRVPKQSLPLANHATFKGLPSVFEELTDSAYVREAQLIQSSTRSGATAPLPFSSPTLWRKVKAGTFPKPVKLSERVTAWKVGDVRAWLLAQESA
jgi:predicted DNA-binding transcriptional regulator AlpA